MEFYKKLFKLLMPYKKYLIGISILMLIAGIGSAITPLLQQVLFDEGILNNTPIIVLQLSALMGSAIAICKVATYFHMKLQNEMQRRFIRRMQTDIMNHALRLKMSFIKKEGIMKIVNQAEECIEPISSLTGDQVINGLFEIFKFIGVLIGLLIISWPLTLFLVALIPIRLLISSLFTKKVEAAQVENLEAHSKIHAWEQDVFLGVTEIKLWNLYSKKSKEYEAVLKERDSALKKLIICIVKNDLLGSSIEELCVCCLYIICGFFMLDTGLTIGGLIAFVTYSRYLLQPVGVVSSMRMAFAQIRPALDEYEKFFNLEGENSNDFSATNVFDGNMVEKITFDNVTFSFQQRTILENVSFSIYNGEKIAIIGENGSGKSTLVNLLLRFYEVDSGEISINGMNITSIRLDEYRDLFSVITQMPYLFTGTIAENMTMFGRVVATEGEFSQEALLEFLNNLENKEFTQVGNNSSQISGGEKQKIALFRALYKSSRILIMDEPTANYDVDSEKAFKDILGSNDKDISIIITHDQEILTEVDKILLIKEKSIKVYSSFQQFASSGDYTVLSENSRPGQ